MYLLNNHITTTNMNLPIKPRILASSTSWTGIRIDTFLVSVPTCKLAELRTHRLQSQTDELLLGIGDNNKDISMSANSSRAIPVDKVRDMCLTNPYVPMFTLNQKGMSGMQADTDTSERMRNTWTGLCMTMNIAHGDMQHLGMHKQDLNLIWHPYAWSVCVLTADQYAWADFFKQRCKDDVYPAIRHIAELMQEEYNNTTPEYLEEGEWHLPFVDVKKDTTVDLLRLAKSASCCARISYANDKEEDITVHTGRHDKCLDEKHSGVFEHQNRVPTRDEVEYGQLNGETYRTTNTGECIVITGKYHSNIKGWIQYRKVLGL